MATETLEQETTETTPDAQQPTGAPASSAPAPAAPEPPVGNDPPRDSQGKFAADPMESWVKKTQAIQERAAAEAAKKAQPESDEGSDDTEQQSADDESPPTDPAAQSGEGPSAEMLTVAKRLGVPQALLDTLQSDAELRVAIAMAPGTASEPPGREEAAPQGDDPQQSADDFAVKLLLPEGYVEADDPLIAQTKHLVEEMNRDRQIIARLAEKVFAQEERVQREQQFTQQSRFDATLDELDWPEVGKSQEIFALGDKARESTPFRIRALLYDEFTSLSETLPDFPPAQVAKLAYQRVFRKEPAAPAPKKSPQQVAKEQALLKQSQKRLGGGYVGPPAPEPELSEEERWIQTVAKARSRR